MEVMFVRPRVSSPVLLLVFDQICPTNTYGFLVCPYTRQFHIYCGQGTALTWLQFVKDDGT
jgi:hypothetical protein